MVGVKKIIITRSVVSNFESVFNQQLENYLPLKKVRYPTTDKPWITHELSQLARRKQREYNKNGKSKKYIELNKEYQNEQKSAIKAYRQKIMEKVKDSGPTGGYFVLKKMGERLGEETGNDIHLEEHDGLSNSQKAEDIADYFSKVSNEYKSINISITYSSYPYGFT